MPVPTLAFNLFEILLIIREFTAFPDEDICILLLPCLFVAPNVAPVPNDDAPPSIDKKKCKKVLCNTMNRNSYHDSLSVDRTILRK